MNKINFSRFVVVVAALCGLTLASVAHAQKKSLVIGLDGFGYGTMGFDVANTPNMDSLIDGSWATGYNGAYSDQAFAGGVLGTETEQITISGPGWTTMLTGVWANRHNVVDNSFASPDVANNPAYLGTAKALDNSLTTATFLWWPILNSSIIDPINSDADPNNNLDYQWVTSDDNATVADVVEKLNMDGVNDVDADLSFVELDDGDAAGHSCGSSGECYKDELEELDGQVGQMLAAIQSRPTFASEEWQIIVTSDHGHLAGGGHGGQSTIERTIPFIVSSQSLTPGDLDLTAANVSQADVAPTVLDHFGIAIPEHYAGFSRAAGQLPPPSPDINGDTFVNQADVVAFAALWLQPNTQSNPNPADLNLDGISDLADAFILHQALLAAGVGEFTFPNFDEVPEPTTFNLLLILGTLCLGIMCLRR